MKTEHRILSINYLFLIITIILFCWTIGTASAEECPDLIVNGGEVTVDGRCYGIIFVKNNGKLTINGDTTAQSVLIQWGQAIVNGNLDVADYITVQANPTGTMTVNGDVSANRISIEGGTLTINGTLYDVSQIIIQSGKLTVSTSGSSKKQPIESLIVESGELHLCGNWFVNDMRINGGVVYVIPYFDSLEGSGTFFLECDQLIIEVDGSINADGAGGDARGIGGGGYGAGGGGYGGYGGNGQGGAGGNKYGDNFSLIIDMGSRGGNYGVGQGGKGGGSTSIISTGDVAIYGTVTANGGNGQDHCGGGSGGGVLILSRRNLELSGSIVANGGNGTFNGGGGGGGRIKLFYETGITIDDVVGKLSVNGGANGPHGGAPGQNGTIWTNAIPNPPELIAPEDGALLVTYRPTFRFNVIDTSVDTDERDDDLSCIIELSVDTFATIYKTYDQDVSLSGWSKFSYKSGDEAEFTPTEDLPQGIYQWRAAIRDKSIRGDYSEVRSFTLGKPGDVSDNGEVTAYDAALVLQYVVGSKNLSEPQLKAADVTNDGTVSALDAALILQYSVGLITKFPVEITTTAPIIAAKSEEGALIKAIAQLEATTFSVEQKKVLKRLKNLVFEKSPKYTTLLQNFPNPFNPETWIPFELSQNAIVTINIYDITGRLVRKLELGNKFAGFYISREQAAYWNGRNDDDGERVASGIYFYQLQAGEFRATRKMVVSK